MLCPKCNSVGCEDGDCVEYIWVKKCYSYEVPKHKYKQLLEELNTKKLFHLDDPEEIDKALEELELITVEKSLEEIEISDEDY